MKLLETVIDDFNISEITANAIKDKGLGAVALINTILDEKAMTLELLFEVKSSVDDPHHVDMKGKERKGLKYGYSVIIKFFGLKPEHIEGLKEGDDEGRLVMYGVTGKLRDDDGDLIPKKMYYNGSIIIITNYNVGALDTALRGRSFVMDINFTTDDLLKIVKKIMPAIDPEHLSYVFFSKFRIISTCFKYFCTNCKCTN